MTLTAPATATGSTLVTVDRHQAGDWQQALASLGRRLPVGWDASGERIGGVGGYDPILAPAYSSARQPWSHAHLGFGALAATNHGFIPLDPGRVTEQAERHIFGYQLLVRRAVTELVGAELGLGWAAPAADGSCEVTGLPAQALQSI